MKMLNKTNLKTCLTVLSMFFMLAVIKTSQAQSIQFGIRTPNFKVIIGSGPYDQYGYDRYGYDCNGYDRDGYDRYGYDCNGYNRYGYDRYGYDCNGYDRYGYDRNGYDHSGYPRYRVERRDYDEHYRGDYDRDDGYGHDNGKHLGWYKNGKYEGRNGKWHHEDRDRD